MDNLDNSSTNEAAFQQNFEIVSSGESGSDVTDVEFQFDDDVFSLYSSAESGSSDDDEFSLNLSVESVSSDNESGSYPDRRGPNPACPAEIPRQGADEVWDWKSTNLQPQSFIFNGNCGIKTSLDESSTKLEIFQQFFAPELLDYIAKQTNLYSSQQPTPSSSSTNDTTFNNTSSEELKVFLATTIMMGVIRKPDLHLYWSRDGMLETPFFRKTIPRDRYIKIMANLHFNDNTLDNGSDRLFKIKPILDTLADKCRKIYFPDQNVSVDESLLKFHGHLRFKQYNPSKRSRFGIKLYRLCQSTDQMCGYTWNFKVYSGQDNDEKTPASTKVVLDLSKDLLGLGYTIYLDKWYSSPSLFYNLLQQGTYAVGTIRLTRKHMPNDFPGRRLKRGECVSKSANGIMALIWKDKKDVKMLSTKHNSEMLDTGKKNREGNAIIKPACVVAYNHGMGGVDRSDQLSATCRSVRKHTKWYKKLFFYMVDIAVVNAFLIFKKLRKNKQRITLTQFKVNLAGQLLEVAEISDYSSRGRPRSLPTPDRLRGKDGHFPKYNPTPDGRAFFYKRCTVCLKHGKRKETKFQCDKCEVPLCILPCFKDFHTKINF